MNVLDYELHHSYTQQRLSEASAQRIARDFAGPDTRQRSFVWAVRPLVRHENGCVNC